MTNFIPSVKMGTWSSLRSNTLPPASSALLESRLAGIGASSYPGSCWSERRSMGRRALGGCVLGCKAAFHENPEAIEPHPARREKRAGFRRTYGRE